MSRKGLFVQLAPVLLLTALLATAMILTKRPWFDEGGYADPAHSLLTRGTLGMPLWDSHVPGQDRANWTFTMPPLHFVLQAGWYALLGIGIVQMRALSLLFGLVTVASVAVIVQGLTGNRRTALLAALLAGCDYTALMIFSDGRMDAMCMGFGMAGLAAWVGLRERSLGAAALAANTAIALSGMSHPAGVIYPLGLVLLALPDLRRIRPRHILLAALPYLMGGAGWGLYILQNVEEFRRQFLGETGGRLQPADRLETAWAGLRIAFGFGPTSEAISRLKLFPPALYMAGLALALWRRPLPGTLSLAGLAVVFCLATLFWLGAKVQYLAHAMPLLAAMLAVGLAAMPRRVGTLLAAALIAFNLASVGAYSVLRNGFARHFDPVAQALRLEPAARAIAPAEFAFAAGFDGRLVDDPYLGVLGDRPPPDFLVIDEHFVQQWTGIEALEPEVWARIVQRRSQYRLILDTGYYQLFQLDRSRP